MGQLISGSHNDMMSSVASVQQLYREAVINGKRLEDELQTLTTAYRVANLVHGDKEEAYRTVIKSAIAAMEREEGRSGLPGSLVDVLRQLEGVLK